MSTTTPNLCVICDKPIEYSGAGRPSVVCGRMCRLTHRRQGEQRRRERRLGPITPPSPELAALGQRVRVSLRESAAARADDYEEQRERLAAPSDFYNGEPGEQDRPTSLGDLGVSFVDPTADGGTAWESDPSLKAQTRYARAAAGKLKAEAIEKAEAEARDEAYVYDLDDAEAEVVRAELIDEARRHAKAIALALRGDDAAAAVARRIKVARESRKSARNIIKAAGIISVGQ